MNVRNCLAAPLEPLAERRRGRDLARGAPQEGFDDLGRVGCAQASHHGLCMAEASVLLAEHRRMPPAGAGLVGWLHARGGPVTVAMEATLYWAWLQAQLSAVGITAVAAIHGRRS